MHLAKAHLKSVSVYSQGKYIPSEKEPKETHADYERRIWRKKMHRTEDGHVFIPPMSFKLSLSEAAKFSSRQIPGKGKATYTKHFKAGVLVIEGLVLSTLVDDVDYQIVHVPADGVTGSGKRVEKYYPIIPHWEGVVEYHVLDDTITQEVFTETLAEAGRFIGIGVFRPACGGYWGRFEIISVEWD